MTSQLRERPDLPTKVVDALQRGEREEAIVGIQQELHLSREDARDLVANYILLTPGMRMKDTESNTPTAFTRSSAVTGGLMLANTFVMVRLSALAALADFPHPITATQIA